MTIECIITEVDAVSDDIKELVGLTGEETMEEAVQKLQKAKDALDNQKRGVKITATKIKEYVEYFDNAVDNEGLDPYTAVSNMITYARGMGKKAYGGISIEAHQNSILNEAHSMIADILKEYKPKLLGFGKTRSSHEDLMRAIKDPKHGGEDLQKLAGAWRELTSWLADRFNKAGGGIIKREASDFAMPQVHNLSKTSKVTTDEWVAFVKDTLDKEKVMKSLGIDPKAKDASVSYHAALRVVGDTVRTDKLNKYRPNTREYRMANKIGDRHQASRILHFKNADAYVNYQKKFGDDQYYTAMLSYVDMITREIGAMEKLGPNADHVMKKVIEYAESKDPGKWAKVVSNPENQYKDIMGYTIGEANGLSRFFRGARNIGYGATLGSASITAVVTDPLFMAMTAKMNGIGGLKPLKRIFNKMDRETALRLGVITNQAISHATQALRWGDSVGTGLTAKYANFTMAVSLLSPWTTAAKVSNSMAYLEEITTQLSKNWKDVKGPFKKFLIRYGVNGDDWIALQKAGKYEGFVNLNNLKSNDLKSKIIGSIWSETKMAVPEPDARVRAAYRRGTKGGTFWGETIKTAGILKTFGLTMIMSNLTRAAQMEGASKLGYVGSLLAGTTILGTVSYSVNELIRGKTPGDWTNPMLWLKGFERGGALGIVNDFVSSGFHSAGILSFAAGPVFATVDEVVIFMFGTMKEVNNLEKNIYTRLGMGALGAAERAAPNLWFTRLLLKREMFDQIEKAVNPKFYSNQKRVQTNMREKGQKHWWKPGESKVVKKIKSSLPNF